MKNRLKRDLKALLLIAALVSIPLVAYAANFGALNITGNLTAIGSVSAGGALGGDGGIAVAHGASFDTLTISSALNKGTCTVDGGAACSAITVASGAICVCADGTGIAACSASVTSTSLTLAGTAAHAIQYLCE